MKIHKTVTEKVVQANRKNAEKSTGPKSPEGKRAARHNAVRHGLLAKQVLFRHREAERNEFKHLLNNLERDYLPVGVVEKMLVEEIGTCWWKLRTATRWEIKGLRGHREASKQVILQLHQQNADNAVLNCWNNTPQWECETLVVRSRKDNADTNTSAYTRQKLTVVPPIASSKASMSRQQGGGTEIEATLKGSLPTILRYATNLKRDFYKAIDMLEELQRRRKEDHRKKHRKKRLEHS